MLKNFVWFTVRMFQVSAGLRSVLLDSVYEIIDVKEHLILFSQALK